MNGGLVSFFDISKHKIIDNEIIVDNRKAPKTG
jgi:hypothetical protein